MTDFGLFNGSQVEATTSALSDVTNTRQETDVSEAVPNALSPKKAPVMAEKQKAFQSLDIREAYDMAKIFNGPGQTEQRSIVNLCESFLNINFKKRPTPAFAVSKNLPLSLTRLSLKVH